ncbi:type II toxin-antitoxin system RelE/ParE family toxin [uncultured Maricaulis sp.]|uniref:type II toxin-antitoxin system RelE/ParE family toxin n=1 Tax=uncultured Maricaulis sp. TaxID=174710 RepID=UPI0030D7C570|tara:strand:+ start:426 stop:719 length:294 start_codon:yes stop_codon:yes gene_type:complete
MRYRLTRAAEADLVGIYREGAVRFGVAQAEAYFVALIASFERIAANPRLARLRMEIDPPVRIHPCGSHIVIYREAALDGIEILRIRHGREDWDEAGR